MGLTFYPDNQIKPNQWSAHQCEPTCSTHTVLRASKATLGSSDHHAGRAPQRGEEVVAVRPSPSNSSAAVLRHREEFVGHVERGAPVLGGAPFFFPPPHRSTRELSLVDASGVRESVSFARFLLHPTEPQGACCHASAPRVASAGRARSPRKNQAPPQAARALPIPHAVRLCAPSPTMVAGMALAGFVTIIMVAQQSLSRMYSEQLQR